MSECCNCLIAGPCSVHYKDGGAPPCSSKRREAAPSASANKLQAKIAAIVKETDEECDGDCDSGEILNDLVANLRQLSAVQ